MSFATLRSEVAACRAWERSLHAGSAQTRAAAALPGRFDAFLPLVMPLYGLLGWATGMKFQSEWWAVVLPWWILLSTGRVIPRTAPTEWEALRLPSRRGWLLARWSLRLPWLLLLGLCTSAHHLLLAHRDVPHPEGIRWALVASLLLAPLLVAALAAWFPLQERAFGGRSWVAPLFALVLVLILAAAAVAVYVRKESGPGDMPLVSGSLAVIAGLILFLTLPSRATLRRGAARYSGGTGILSTFVHGLSGMAAIAPATVLAISSVIPRSVVVQPGDPLGGPFPAILLAMTLVGIVVTAAHALRLVGTTDVGVEPRPEVRVKRVTASVPARNHSLAGRGLRAAAWALYRGGWRTLQHPWLMFLPKLLWEFRAPVCGAVAVVAVVFGSTIGGFKGLLAPCLAMAFLAVIPAPLRLPASRRLHLLGGDFSAVAVHNLRWGILLAVIPAALGGALPFLLLGAEDPPPFLAFAGAWGGAVAFLLLREGAGFIDALIPDTGWAVLTLATCLLGGWMIDAPTTLGVAGTAMFALALRSTVREFRHPDLAGARFAAGAVDD